MQHSRLLRRASSNLPRQAWASLPTTAKTVPTQSEAENDHERLHERLRFYGMEEWKVRGDGNCQARSARPDAAASRLPPDLDFPAPLLCAAVPGALRAALQDRGLPR